MKKNLLFITLLLITAIAVSACSPSGTNAGTVEISVKGFDDKVIIEQQKIAFSEGESIMDITQKVLSDQKIPFEQSGGFITSIDGQAQMDKGPQSGWRYALNSEFPSLGAKSIKAKDNDKIEWIYALDMNDPGGVTPEDTSGDDTAQDEPVLNQDMEKTIAAVKGSAAQIFDQQRNLVPFRVVLANNLLGEKINENFEILQDKSSANYAVNILTLLAAGKDPADYQQVNYVKLLEESQNDSGKFIVNDMDDYPSTQAYAIAALEMAKSTSYDRQKALDALISMINEDGSVGTYKDVDTAGMSLIGFINAEDEASKQAVEKIAGFIKSKQLETGGFPGFDGKDNPYTVSAVINGLMAAGIDPVSEEFTAGGKTIKDSLLAFIKEDRFAYEDSGTLETELATEQGYLAAAELYTGKSSIKVLEE